MILIKTKLNKSDGSMFNLLADFRNSGLQVKMIFDVGAHKEECSKMVKLIIPKASICLFEPQIEMSKHLDNSFINFQTYV